jgi:steroid delta-isomerase-like uncharacterized protein
MMQKRCFSALMVSMWCLSLVLFIGQPAMATEPVEVLDAYIAGWNSHDPAQCASHFDPDIEFYDATVGTPVKGNQNVLREIVRTFMTAVPDLKLERGADVLVNGDRMAYQWTFSGTNTGAWSDGTPATNKPFKIQGLTLMRLKDGKIVYSGDYYDAYGFYKQLGLLE